MLHPPSRAYVEPWTGDFFGEGGVEQDPHIYPGSAAAGAHGEVIMPKLGNATAKYVNQISALAATLIVLAWQSGARSCVVEAIVSNIICSRMRLTLI